MEITTKCKKFSENFFCPDGNKCKYVHKLKEEKLCTDHENNVMNYDHCYDLHYNICRWFAKGYCRNGTTCEYDHIIVLFKEKVILKGKKSSKEKKKDIEGKDLLKIAAKIYDPLTKSIKKLKEFDKKNAINLVLAGGTALHIKHERFKNDDEAMRDLDFIITPDKSYDEEEFYEKYEEPIFNLLLENLNSLIPKKFNVYLKIWLNKYHTVFCESENPGLEITFKMQPKRKKFIKVKMDAFEIDEDLVEQLEGLKLIDDKHHFKQQLLALKDDNRFCRPDKLKKTIADALNLSMFKNGGKKRKKSSFERKMQEVKEGIYQNIDIKCSKLNGKKIDGVYYDFPNRILFIFKGGEKEFKHFIAKVIKGISYETDNLKEVSEIFLKKYLEK